MDHGTPRFVGGSGGAGVHRGHRRGIRPIQLRRSLTTARSRSELEQYLVPSLSLRRHQLHEKLGLRLLRRHRIMDRSLHLHDFLTQSKTDRQSDNNLVTSFQIRSAQAPADKMKLSHV
jgi:hypothetical protein